MLERTFTMEEINNITNNLYLQYRQHYSDGKMNFSEYLLLENLIIRIQNEFEKKFKGNDDDGKDA